MIKLILLLSVISISANCNTHKRTEENQKQIEEFPPPPARKIDKDNLIGFACYYSGSMSDPVKMFSNFLRKKDYKSIRKKLHDASPAERYLSTVTCERLLHKGLIKLTDTELNQIAKNKESKALISICSGCTSQEELTMQELFYSEKNFLSDNTKNWLQEMIN